jgi:hypothetical protein
MIPGVRGTIFRLTMGALLLVAGGIEAQAEPDATRVMPQRLTLFVGQGEYRVMIEGRELDKVTYVIGVDATQTGYRKELPEIETRIMNKGADRLEFVMRAAAMPQNGRGLQLLLIYGHQKVLIPANVFQFDVR